MQRWYTKKRAKRKIWKRTRKDILNDKLEYETTVTAKACKLHGSKFEDSIPWALKYEASVESKFSICGETGYLRNAG